MRGKSMALLILALGCGLVASIGITQVVKRNPEPAPTAAETGPVFVAVKDIALGEALNALNVKVEQWPKDKIPPAALGKLEDVDGRRTKTRIYAGEPILAVKIYGKGASEQGASPQIPKGMGLVGVRVDSVSSNGGLIMPGDRVDVLVHLQPNTAAGINEPTVRTLLQFIKVFAVNDVLNNEGLERDRSIAAKTVSLLVTPEQAQRVTMASEMGQVRLILRGMEDENTGTDIPSFSSREMLSGRRDPSAHKASADLGTDQALLDFLQRGTAQRPEADPAPHDEVEQPLATFRMRFYIGPAVQDVILKKFADSHGGAANSSGWTSDEPKSSASASGNDGDAAAKAPSAAPAPAVQAKPSPLNFGPPPENGPPPGGKSPASSGGGAKA
jgi:pilus assembly protein CpaB